MKHFLLLCALLFIFSVQAQVSNEKIKLYAKHFAVRNAHIIQCDSISVALEVVYFDFIKAIFSKKQNIPSKNGFFTLKEIHRRFHKEILSFLKGKPKRIYRRLWRNTGNILLLKRRK